MKILWALQPFHQDTTRIQSMYLLLQQLSEQESDIEVGFIVTRTEMDLTMAFKIPQEERFSTYPRRLLVSVLRKANLLFNDKKIHVVDYETLSNTKSVDRLLLLAKVRNVDLIALYTHARQGFKRFAIGSFAETAIHRSKKSLLLVNPSTRISTRINEILYSSDFSPETEMHLQTIIKICQQTGAGLTIFHQAEAINKSSLEESNPKINAYRRRINRMKLKIEEECQQVGLRSRIIVAEEQSATADLILKTANKSKADLIVACAKSGPLTALMGGSTIRQIIRNSQIPVLILK